MSIHATSARGGDGPSVCEQLSLKQLQRRVGGLTVDRREDGMRKRNFLGGTHEGGKTETSKIRTEIVLMTIGE